MQQGGILAGKYRLIRRLGEGGEGSVYLAIHIQTEMFWAIKQIRVREGSENASSCHELQMMKSLKHRHLPQIIDVLEEADSIWLVMEHVRGVSLDCRLKEVQTLSFEEVQDTAEQVAEALCYLESREPPVCHLDIKPSNLIRRPDGLIKLVDFGSAWKAQEQMKRMGTDGYAAPEQYQSDGPQPDVRTDIYALGATLYRMVTGKTRPPSMKECDAPDCPEPLSRLIMKCLQEEPARRFQSAASLREALAGNRKMDRHREGRRRLLGALAMAFPAAALCVQILPSALDLSADESWDYGKLVREAGVVSEEESRDYYRRAVFLEPGRSDAYLKFLADAQMDGIFSDSEETFLRDLLHTVRPGSDQTYEEFLAQDTDAYLETALQIGLAYWYSCERQDSGRIAMGWFEKASEAGESEEAKRYLRLGTALGKIRSVSEQDRTQNAAQYWENLTEFLKAADRDFAMEDVLMRLKFCREMLRTILFLSGYLARAGIGPDEQAARIHLLEQLAAKTEDESKTHELQRKILGEIRQAAESALEAAGHIRAETERPGRSAPGNLPDQSVRKGRTLDKRQRLSATG